MGERDWTWFPPSHVFKLQQGDSERLHFRVRYTWRPSKTHLGFEPSNPPLTPRHLIHFHSSLPQVLFSRVAQQGQLAVLPSLRPGQGDGEPRHGRLCHDLPVLPGGFSITDTLGTIERTKQISISFSFFLNSGSNLKERKTTVDVFKHLNLVEHLTLNLFQVKFDKLMREALRKKQPIYKQDN